MQKVDDSTAYIKIISNCHFSFQLKLLLEFLSDKIQSFADGSNIDGRGGDDETRLKSALVILYLMDKYDMPLTPKQKFYLFDGFKMPDNVTDNPEEIKDMINNVKSELGITADDRYEFLLLFESTIKN